MLKNIYNISGTLISGGLEPEKTSANLKRDLTPSVGWTKSDMRHPHKVTTQMKPLPELEIIPPFSAENKEADVDREKRKMLTNNVSMMQMEVTKICNRFKIPLASLDKDNLDKYPDAAKEKLGLALNCVRNAEVTLTDFLDFLKNDKYKEWNDEQKAKRESLLRSMIGETPQGEVKTQALTIQYFLAAKRISTRALVLCLSVRLSISKLNFSLFASL